MKRTLSVILEKEPGALVRVISMINRRRFKFESFTIGGCESKYFDRMTIVIINDNYQGQREGDAVLQLIKQLRRLINVIEVVDITFTATVQRELMLIKIKVNSVERAEILALMKIFRFKIVDTSPSMLMLEIIGDPGKIVALEELLKNYEIIELIRTGKIGLMRDSSISNSSVAEFPQLIKKSFGQKYQTEMLKSNN